MLSLELTHHLCAIYNHVATPFNILTFTKFSTLKEELDKKTQACEKCGIHLAYVAALLESFRASLFLGINDGSKHGKDTEEHHLLKLVMYYGAMTAHVKHPFCV